MSTASEKANLARIRDNQRRSRARRKEYLQELEARLRQCELQGIEASAEIQMAARRVADENKKLRGLLAQHGIGDDSVEAYLQSSPTTDSVMQGQYGSSSTAVQVLEQLLQARKPCCSEGNTGAPTNSGMGIAGSRDSSASQSTVQSLWDPIHPPKRSGQSTGKAASSAHQFMTPSSSGSRASNAGLSHASNHSAAQYQRLTPVSLPRNPSPASGRARHDPQLFGFGSQLSLSTTTYDHSAAARQHLQPHSMPQRSSVYMPTTTTSSNVNSCVFATDMITTMAGGEESAVRADLGCAPGMDCEVDNQLIFNVMDRYTGQGVGL